MNKVKCIALGVSMVALIGFANPTTADGIIREEPKFTEPDNKKMSAIATTWSQDIGEQAGYALLILAVAALLVKARR